MPIAMPVITRRDGSLHAIKAATAAVNSGFAPFNIPVSAEDTYRSANGNMLSGNAIQNAPSATIFSQSERSTGLRADGKHNSVRNPTASRTNVTPPGPIAPSASAINKYDAPQINPGSERITQSAAPDRCSVGAAVVIEFVSFAICVSAGRRISAMTAQAKSHFGEPQFGLYKLGKQVKKRPAGTHEANHADRNTIRVRKEIDQRGQESKRSRRGLSQERKRAERLVRLPKQDSHANEGRQGCRDPLDLPKRCELARHDRLLKSISLLCLYVEREAAKTTSGGG